MKYFRTVCTLFVLIVVISIAGCGGGGNASNGGTDPKLARSVTTIAGNATASSIDGIGANAGFSNPAAIASDGTYLYVADADNYIIRKIEISTRAVTTLAGKAGESGGTDGIGASARFYSPQGIATDGTNLYVVDASSQLYIRKIVIATGEVTTLSLHYGGGVFVPFTYVLQPYGIVIDGAYLYVTDSEYSTVRKIEISTGNVTILAGTFRTYGSADGTGAEARFNFLQGIVSDGTNLYVADSGNGSIRKIVISTGVVTTLVNGLSRPGGIAMDGTSLYVVADNSICKFEISTGAMTAVAGSSTPGLADAVGAGARFSRPNGITLVGTSLYVADSGNNLIRMVDVSSVSK